MACGWILCACGCRAAAIVEHLRLTVHKRLVSTFSIHTIAHPQVEDLLEYYLQRSSATQSEAERLLEGARDLEESIGVSLSARR
jgi:hypothetical protein